MKGKQQKVKWDWEEPLIGVREGHLTFAGGGFSLLARLGNSALLKIPLGERREVGGEEINIEKGKKG